MHSYFSFFLLTVLINLFHMMIFAHKSFLWEKREQAAREKRTVPSTECLEGKLVEFVHKMFLFLFCLV